VPVVVNAVAAAAPPPPPPPQSEFASLHQNDDMLLLPSLCTNCPHSCSSFWYDLTYLLTSPAYFSCVARFVIFIPFWLFALVRNKFSLMPFT